MDAVSGVFFSRGKSSVTLQFLRSLSQEMFQEFELIPGVSYGMQQINGMHTLNEDTAEFVR